MASTKMEHPWIKRIRAKGQLKVYNKPSSWSDAFDLAIKSFNRLSFGVKLVAVAEEKQADVVSVLAAGPTQYNYFGAIAKTRPGFKGDTLHGQASTMGDEKTRETLFAVIFLPGKVKNATKKQKQVVVVHEFIHACGMEDHDMVGIMASPMQKYGDGLLEYFQIKGAKTMPPIRVGSKTLTIMQRLWPSGGTPKTQ